MSDWKIKEQFSINQADGLKLCVSFFFHSTTEYLMLIDKNTLLSKISDVVIQLNSEKVIKV